jgi:flavodoxin
MKKALIVYHSKHGKTKKFAEEIGVFLDEIGIKNDVISTGDVEENLVKEADTLLLGCWTSGLFLFAQHPERAWKEFAGKLPDLKGKKVGLFTTYKLATGSMFRSMEKSLRGKVNKISMTVKSKKAELSVENKELLKDFIS